MVLFLFASLLGAQFEFTGFKKFERPAPYIGYGLALAKDRDPPRYVPRSEYVALAVPYQIGVLKTKEYRDINLIFLPEVFFNDSFVFFFAGVGPEIEMPWGFRSNPSGLVAGGQAGVYYGFNGTDRIGDDGGKLNFWTRQSMGGLLSLYFGPYFDVRDWGQLRLQFNPKIAFGGISRYTIRSSFSRYIGTALHINLQYKF